MHPKPVGALLLVLALGPLGGLQQQQQQQQQPVEMFNQNFPFYVQSPLQSAGSDEPPSLVVERDSLPVAGQPPMLNVQAAHRMRPQPLPKIVASARKLNEVPVPPQAQAQQQAQPQPQPQSMSAGPTQMGSPPASSSSPPPPPPPPPPSCLYDKNYFAKLDQCLARRPHPAVGLSAFKNEDLLVKQGLSDRRGCVFILNNGLFKSYQINRHSLDSDSQCLDSAGKASLSITFTNVTLSYLWSLRCLNYADQLLDDATLNGRATSNSHQHELCMGSSQNFGFASLQLSQLEAQIELATDIYKNWRVSNVTVAMLQAPLGPTTISSTARSSSGAAGSASSSASAGATANAQAAAELDMLGTSIKEFVFESLDGDELNWRYLNLYQNWTRNRMHTNFLDQFKRFLWISLQRCLSETSDKLPVKLFDLFSQSKYN